VELLLVFRWLWRRRIPLAVGVVAAVAVLVGLGGTKPIKSTSAIAWTRVGLDTPRSQLVDSAPAGADTLTWRSSLLMHLLASDATQKELARRLRVRPDEVTVVDVSLRAPLVPASMPATAAEAANVVVTPYVLTVSIRDYSLPVVSVEAAAPDRAGAKRLADAAVAVLASRASTGGSSPSPTSKGTDVPKLQAFTVEPVAPVRVTEVPATALPLKAIAESFLFLFAWSAAVLVLPLVRRRPGRRAPVAA
jgi:hypothetical protein